MVNPLVPVCEFVIPLSPAYGRSCSVKDCVTGCRHRRTQWSPDLPSTFSSGKERDSETVCVCEHNPSFVCDCSLSDICMLLFECSDSYIQLFHIQVPVFTILISYIFSSW